MQDIVELDVYYYLSRFRENFSIHSRLGGTAPLSLEKRIQVLYSVTGSIRPRRDERTFRGKERGEKKEELNNVHRDATAPLSLRAYSL